MEASNAPNDKDLTQLLNEIKTLNEAYEAKLNLLGFKILSIKEDGNCLFRALSYLFFGCDSLHNIIRYLYLEFRYLYFVTPYK